MTEKFNQLMNSFNVNMRVVFNLPYSAPCWLLEELSGCRHPRQQIYIRFCKFVDSLAGNRKPSLRALFNTVVGDVRSLIGANCRQILMDTAVVVTPGKTRLDKLRSYRVYSAPDGHEWKLPLLVSLLAIRDENWDVCLMMKMNSRRMTSRH